MTVERLKPGLRHLHGAVHQRDLSSPQTSSLGQQHSHRPTAAIRDETGLINGLNGRSCRHQESASAPVLLCNGTGVTTAEQAGGRQLDQQRIRHAPIAMAIAGQKAWLRQQGNHAREGLHQVPVALNGGVVPHRRIHGDGSQDRTLASQEHACEQTIPRSLAPATEAGGTQGGQQDEFSPLRQIDVQRPTGGRIPFVVLSITAVATQGRQGKRAH